jgi:hypothetical protein
VSLRCAETVLSGATHDTTRPENWLGGKSIGEAVVEAAARKDLFGNGAREVVSRPKHAEFSGCRDCFMRQRRPPVENEVGVRQR